MAALAGQHQRSPLHRASERREHALLRCRSRPPWVRHSRWPMERTAASRPRHGRTTSTA